MVTTTILLLAAAASEWQGMGAWMPTAFAGHGDVKIDKDGIVMAAGEPMTGVNFTGAFPKIDYEVRFEGSRVSGGDFFASLTFPVGESFCTWVTGGWGGDIVGFSSIDGWDASDNETRAYFTFENGRWYRMRLRVTAEWITAWIDDKEIVNVSIAGRQVGLRPGDIKLSAPFGFASYHTTGAIRKVEYRVLR